MAIVCAHQGGGTLAFTIARNGRTPTPPDSRSTICACSHRPRRTGSSASAASSRPALHGQSHVNDDSKSRFTRKGLGDAGPYRRRRRALMFERGVANTSIDGVRSAAGVGGSQISHYFRDKRDLTRHVIASRRDDVLPFILSRSSARSTASRLCRRGPMPAWPTSTPSTGWGDASTVRWPATDRRRRRSPRRSRRRIRPMARACSKGGSRRCGNEAICEPMPTRGISPCAGHRPPGRREGHPRDRRRGTAAGRG